MTNPSLQLRLMETRIVDSTTYNKSHDGVYMRLYFFFGMRPILLKYIYTGGYRIMQSIAEVMSISSFQNCCIKSCEIVHWYINGWSNEEQTVPEYIFHLPHLVPIFGFMRPIFLSIQGHIWQQWDHWVLVGPDNACILFEKFLSTKT